MGHVWASGRETERSLGESLGYRLDLRKDCLHVGALEGFRPGKAIDVPSEAGVGQRTKDQLRVVAQVGCVPRHQGDASARFDDGRGYREFVDPVQDPRLVPSDSRDQGESLRERKAFVYRDPFLVAKIRRLDCGFRRESVIVSDCDIQGLVQDRFHTNRPRPCGAADQPMGEHKIMIDGETGEVLLGHIKIAQPNAGQVGPPAGRDQRREDGQAHAMEGGHGNGAQVIALETRHRLRGAFECHLDVDRRQSEGAPGIRECRPSAVPEGQGSGRLTLQGADLL